MSPSDSHAGVREQGWFWVAFHGDWSGFAVFETELEALRYAVENSMQAVRVPTSASVREYVEQHR